MKFFKTRVLPLFLVFVLSVSLLVVPASATASFPNQMVDEYSVAEWNAHISGNGSAIIDAVANILGCPAGVATVFWTFVDSRLQYSVGSVSRGELDALCNAFNEAFNTPAMEYFSLQVVEGLKHEFHTTLAQATLGTFTPSFSVAFDGEYKCLRIIENHTGIWVVNQAGQYPYVTEDDASKVDQWLPLANHNAYDIVDQSVLVTFRINYGGTIITKGDMKFLAKSTGNDLTGPIVLCSPEGRPYAAWVNPQQSATNQDRQPTTGNITENGNIIEGDFTDNSMKLDLSGLTMVLPDGTFQFIDDFYYDASTKSYHIDSHDTYNTYIINHYTWNYYINYTSITYIGQTEEYNKYYEVYYELPDGRSSADLTKEDLEQLNLSVDVIPYGRSADDTSLRSLYHFDGDTKDSSYWNYCTDFTWNKGASLTYMDAGVFEGALYLDETEHDFTIELPSGLGSGDFTFQFRYYQSHTAAPQTDSYIKFGDIEVMKFNGSSLLHYNGASISSMPVGSWNEIALIRENGITYYYLNGVQVSKDSHLGANAFPRSINFHFGSEQQTFKYLDELRVVNYAIAKGGANYTPTSVPHDTNLTLILPTESAPVADEYWNFNTGITPLWSLDLTSGTGDGVNKDSNKMGGLNYWTSRGTSFYQDTNFASLSQSAVASGVSSSMNQSAMKNAIGISTSGWWTPTLGFSVPLAFYDSDHNTGKVITSGDTQGNYDFGYDFVKNKTYTFSIVERSGKVSSFTFTADGYPSSYMNVKSSKSFDWGSIRQITYFNNSYKHCVLWFNVEPGKTLDVVYMELVQGSTPNTGHEFVSSVTGIDKADLNTPTLAVRTDIDITSYQIGGVRPSLPTKGQVWAMIENDRIVSLQIYNGQAWEGVDGRIWTGERWIPMSSYNIITLQDLYDIVDATPNYEYIYSEAGFWSWWQKSWNAFTEKLFLALGSGTGGSGASGGAGSSELNKVDLDSAPVGSDPMEEDSKSLWQFIILVVDGGKSVVTGTRHLFSGVVSTIPDTMENITGAFDSGGIAVGILDGSDPDAADMPGTFSDESEVLDPWRYR